MDRLRFQPYTERNQAGADQRAAEQAMIGDRGAGQL